MLDNISRILKTQCKIKADDLLLIGVSGGPDSLCLLHVLHQIGHPIVALHVNHKLRPEADQESQVVKHYVSDLGIKYISCEADVLTYSDEQSISVEEAARALRYRLLFEHARNIGAKAVVVGHNADDQVETILMHLIRGSGLGGLRGMEFRTIPNSWSEEIPLVRPFLSTWRADIQKYLDGQELKPISDSSNMDVSYFRNRLRHELLPILENYNPSIHKIFLRMGHILKDDYALLQQMTDIAWKSVYKSQGNGYLVLDTPGFLEQPLSIQRYLLRKAIAYLIPGLRDVDFECIERGVMILVDVKTKSRTELVAGLSLTREADQFWIKTWQADLDGNDFPALQTGDKIVLSIPSVLKLENGWQLTLEKIQNFRLDDIRIDASEDPFQAWLDVDELILPLIVRSRRPGDQIKSLGLDGHSIKISDLMVNLKLPNRARANWPLVCSGEEIMWVPGYRISHLARIKLKTSSVVHLKLSRLDPT